MTITLERALRQSVGGALARHLGRIPSDAVLECVGQDLVILVANRIEAADSPLCDCRREVNAPRNWRTGAYLEHHCDCAAVKAAQRILEGITGTLHSEQCPGCA